MTGGIMGLLEGKRALVTGGTTGLGLAIAARFQREGARVVITGRDHDLGERAERTLGAGARFVAADAADPDAVASSVSAAVDRLGGLDVLVNNAGVGVTARLIEMSGVICCMPSARTRTWLAAGGA
jgi:NAD(P)-dependent dehydrogenase (short-subunit alcohol dehydrogenase family)